MALLFVAIALFAVLGLALMAVSSSRSQQQPQNKHQPANQHSAADPGKAETDKPKPDHGTEIHKAQNYWERYGQGESQYNPQGGQHTQNNQKATQASGQSSPGVQIDCDPNCAAKHTESDTYENAIARLVRKTVDDPLALFTAGLAIATIGLVLVVLWQVRDARKSSERQLRAYVSISRVEISRREKDASVPGAGNLEWYYPTQHNDSD